MKYRHRVWNQRDLGRLFGVTSHTIGRWLEAVGLREEASGKPTNEAFRSGFCDLAASGAHGHTWGWVAERVVPRMVEAGHPLALDLPTDLAEPSPLNGPFSVGSGNPLQVVNADGSPAAQMWTAKNAEAVAKMLNLAHRHGQLERWLA